MRNLTTVPVLLALSLGALAACSSDEKDDDCSTVPAGAASTSVKVSGAFGKADPKATFDTPLTTKEDDLQRTVLDEGDGDTTADGDQVEAIITVFNGRTGKQALSQPATLTAGDKDTFEAFRAGIECVPTGSRVVTAVSAGDVYGTEGYAELDIKASDSLVIVTDVVDVREELKAKPWKDAPAVDLTGDKPRVKLAGEPPKDTLLKVLEKGTGETVKSGDTITVNYQGRTWESGGKVFQQTFGGGQPAQLSTENVVQGFKAAVVGQKVGAKVFVTMPPEYGYGTEESADNELGGKTLAFIVEIVSID